MAIHYTVRTTEHSGKRWDIPACGRHLAIQEAGRQPRYIRPSRRRWCRACWPIVRARYGHLMTERDDVIPDRVLQWVRS